MLDYLQENYSTLLIYSFAIVFIPLFLWEFFSPWQKTICSLPLRWWNTLCLYLINRSSITLLLPMTTLPAAFYAQENNLGLQSLNLHPLLNILVAILLYDLFHYWSHRLLHIVPVLWRLHRLHHSDPDVDISTEFKHHPLESVASGLLSVGFIIASGVHPIAIIVRALGAQIVSLASHANIRLPQVLDQKLRLVIITPAMHRIHHSSWQPETDSNYGTLFSFWDRLFKSYVANPEKSFEHMQVGLDEFRAERDLWLDRLLIQPFVSGQPKVADRGESLERNDST